MTLEESDNQFRLPQGDKLQSICFLIVVHSFTHPIEYPGQRYHCLILESTQRVELVSKMMQGVW